MDSAKILNIQDERSVIEALADDFQERLSELVPDLTILRLQSGSDLPSSRTQVDFLADVTFGGRVNTLVVEVKSSDRPENALLAAHQLKMIAKEYPDSYSIFVAPYIGARARDILMEQGIGFLDLVGNAFLRFGGIYVDKTSTAKRPPTQHSRTRIFSRKSSRITRVLLADKDRLWRLRELAGEAKVSLGLTQRVVKRLTEDAYLEKTPDKKMRLRAPGPLLDAWREEYKGHKDSQAGFHISPSAGPESIMRRIAETCHSTNLDCTFTMFAAAGLVAPFVRSDEVHVYVQGDRTTLSDALDAREVEFGGNLFLLQAYDEGVFYGRRSQNSLTVVSDLQVYLDLYGYAKRGREQAEYLREHRIKF
ncbi:MAG: hypothetical protein IIC91_00675 [Chloroflexi bacterium]|nr:hypothetical protein [Chloroflexota bacterium]